jgi:hypothetical protein
VKKRAELSLSVKDEKELFLSSLIKTQHHLAKTRVCKRLLSLLPPLLALVAYRDLLLTLFFFGHKNSKKNKVDTLITFHAFFYAMS